jgi:RimJ/RimL family protein N-acetyltransferase
MKRGQIGPTVRIRRIRATDIAALERFYAELSVDSRVTRFLGAAPALDHGRSQTFCTTDHQHREGFVAVLGEGDGPERIVGHLCIEPDDTDSAEIAVAVADRLQGRGIGRGLVRAAVAWGRRVGLRRLDATAFATNSRIIGLLRSLGLPVVIDWRGGSTCEMSIHLRTLSAAA